MDPVSPAPNKNPQKKSFTTGEAGDIDGVSKGKGFSFLRSLLLSAAKNEVKLLCKFFFMFLRLFVLY